MLYYLYPNDIKDVQSEKRLLIVVILLVSHPDISGKDIIDEQPSKRPSISVNLLVSHFDISGKFTKEVHL